MTTSHGAGRFLLINLNLCLNFYFLELALGVVNWENIFVIPVPD
jgi:hypothetical protein